MLTRWAVDSFPHPCVFVCTHPSVHVLIVGNLCSHASSDISDELRSFAVEWSGNGREGTVNLYFHTVTEGVHCFERKCANVYIKQHWSVVCYKAPDSHWIASFWNWYVLTEYFLPKVIDWRDLFSLSCISSSRTLLLCHCVSAAGMNHSRLQKVLPSRAHFCSC